MGRVRDADEEHSVSAAKRLPDLPDGATLVALVANDPGLKIVRVDVPEWGYGLYVRGLSGAERDALEEATVRARLDKEPSNIRGRMAAWAICTRDGKRLYADDDAEALGRLSAAGLDRVYEAAAGISRLSARDAEDLEGNSGSAPSD